ncbi:hypothetical protein [Candidatus Poriferisocius sp.]|uniref:hypothetical protein n=1 Tax=Candidatus Poriferisocius sp. TaxID=3101276 RepID=UPI003B0125B9
MSVVVIIRVMASASWPKACFGVAAFEVPLQHGLKLRVTAPPLDVLNQSFPDDIAQGGSLNLSDRLSLAG